MRDVLGRAWRVAAAALCFAGFGVGGLVLGLLVFPALGCAVRDDVRRSLVARRVILQAFRALVGTMRLTGLISYEIHGRHLLQPPGQLILANHPTLIDVVFLLSLVGRADCVVKAALARNPFTRGPVRAAGFVFNDSGAALLDDCVASVRAGNNLIVFPEGTRTPASGKMTLQRGAARIALQGALDILPVHISCMPVVLGKHQKWHCVAAQRAHFCIRVGNPIAIAPFLQPSHPALAARHLTDYLTDHFALETRRANTRIA